MNQNRTDNSGIEKSEKKKKQIMMNLTFQERGSLMRKPPGNPRLEKEHRCEDKGVYFGMQ